MLWSMNAQRGASLPNKLNSYLPGVTPSDKSMLLALGFLLLVSVVGSLLIIGGLMKAKRK